MHYNLLDENWIPVLYQNGEYKRVGIRKALQDAGTIRQIASSNPMDNVALLRFLLVVLLWCKGNPTENDRELLTRDTDGIPKGWLEKLTDHKEKFHLLGDGERFMQAPERAKNSRPVADLFHELPGDTNVTHLRHIRDYCEGICLGCVAIGFTRLPVAMTGKGKGKRPGINGDPPAYFVPVGETVLNTLKLNWPFSHIPGDHPCWQTDLSYTEDQVGVMEGFTWTSRQFRIAESDLKPGSCLVCGAETESLVTCLRELNEQNGRDDLSRCDHNRWRDPHLAYNQDNKAWRMEDSEKDLPGSAGQWRDWLAACFDGNNKGITPPQAIVSAAKQSNGKLRVMVAGIATRQNDKCIESWSHVVQICARHPLECLKLANEAVTRLLDPSVTFTGNKLSSFKAKHPLRVIRHEMRPLSDSARSALADRLPALELGMFNSVQSDDGVAVGFPRDLAEAKCHTAIGDVAKSTTPGSPLRRREALRRADSALDEALRKIAADNENVPSTADNQSTNEANASKPKPRRKKKESGT
ncbi:MAG: hypothetical protein AMXMBFR4_32530 [Candidatus Hydrogenedentota bacterium]